MNSLVKSESNRNVCLCVYTWFWMPIFDFRRAITQYFICLFNIRWMILINYIHNSNTKFISNLHSWYVGTMSCEVPAGSKHSFEFIQWSEIKLYEIIQASSVYCHFKWKLPLKVKRKIASKINWAWIASGQTKERRNAHTKTHREKYHTRRNFQMNNTFPEESSTRSVYFTHKKGAKV